MSKPIKINVTDEGDLVIPAESIPKFAKALGCVMDVAAWGSNLTQVGEDFDPSYNLLVSVLREVE